MRRLLSILLFCILSTPGLAQSFPNVPGAVTVSNSVTAGTGCPSTATTVPSVYNILTTVASGTCVTLPTTLNAEISVVDRGANPVSVYPPSGAAFEGLSANSPIVVPVNGYGRFLCSTSTQCYQTNYQSVGLAVIGNYTMPQAAYVNSSFSNIVAGFQQDIVDAQSMGIDAFELDMQYTGTQGDFNYNTGVADMFQAAHNLGTGFKILLFADCQAQGSACQSGIASLMSTYASDPNYLHYQGKPVMTGYSQSAVYDSTSGSADETFWHGLYTSVTGAGVTPCFIQSSQNEQYVVAPANIATQITNNTSWYINDLKSDTCGIGMWGHDPASIDLANQDGMASVMASNNKILMGSVIPWFAQARFAFMTSQGAVTVSSHEQHGFEGMIAEWMDVIKNLHTPFVRIQTWNDHTESYADLASTSVLQGSNNKSDWQMPPASLWSHAPYAVVNEYFTQWYHTGVQPTNWPDYLFVSYRNASRNVTASSNPSGTTVTMNWDPDGTSVSEITTLDDVYVTTFLTSPATLTVTLGSNTTTLYPNTGVQSFRIPFTNANQTVSAAINRGGSNLIALSSSSTPSCQNIVNSETLYYNINPVTCYGHD